MYTKEMVEALLLAQLNSVIKNMGNCKPKPELVAKAPEISRVATKLIDTIINLLEEDKKALPEVMQELDKTLDAINKGEGFRTLVSYIE